MMSATSPCSGELVVDSSSSAQAQAGKAAVHGCPEVAALVPSRIVHEQVASSASLTTGRWARRRRGEEGGRRPGFQRRLLEDLRGQREAVLGRLVRNSIAAAQFRGVVHGRCRQYAPPAVGPAQGHPGGRLGGRMLAYCIDGCGIPGWLPGFVSRRVTRPAASGRAPGRWARRWWR